MYKLLIVDDNYTHIEFVSECIDWNMMGFTEIKVAHDGVEGYEVYKEFKPELIITDVAMPKSDGIEMVRKIRQTDSVTEIIFMSCYEEFSYVKASIDANAASYISKPINPVELKNTVQSVCTKLKTMRHFSDCFVHNIVFSAHMDGNISQALQQRLGFLQYSSMLMVKYVILEDTQDYEKIHFLQNILDREFSAGYHLQYAVLSPNELAVLFMSQEKDEDLFLEKLFEMLSQNINYICSVGKLKTAAGVSKTADNVMHSKELLEQASQALNNSNTLCDGDIYFYEDSLHTANSFNISELKNDVYAYFENNASFTIDVFMDKYFPPNKVYVANDLNQLCLSVVTITQILFLDRNISIDQIFDEPNIVWKKLSDFSSILNVKQWIKNFLMVCFEYSNTAENTKYPKIVSAIKEYIDKNYADITSVSDIASTLYISPGYAKNIFKKHTGQTISEYLLDVRIKNACRLLKNPDIKVYEVRELIGYQSKAHFIEVFKKKVGKTPKEYQQNPQ